MDREFVDLLTAYLAGWKTIFDCDEWLAGVNWDDPDLDSESRNILGRLELLATEVAEGFREEEEFWQEAADIVDRATGSRYVVLPPTTASKTADSSNDLHTAEIIVTSAEAAQSWSMSPLLEPG